MQLDFCFDFNREAERQLGHADSAAGVRPNFFSKDADDEITEAVDYSRLLIKPGR